ncbi:YybH family protein [Aquimarina sp. 2304DJ70-9]|uniref:YybH family protein n=1 Tax=Aquimarina penaris TaxID=3231044 RepID=UPI0034618364
MKTLSVIILFFILSGCKQHTEVTEDTLLIKDNNKDAIHTIHDNYVNGWKNMNEEQIMSLFENNARIQPNSLKPIEGKEKIRSFWFPKDSSITTINAFETELLNLDIKDSLAITTHTTLLDWSYQKDTIQFGMTQKGINTTVYRKQKDASWKIWRKMWTDIYSKRK